MDLSVSIVSFNTREVLLKCIQSVMDHCASLQHEIIVVDNASTDGSAEAVKANFPSVKLIENKTNLYFSKAHNQAFATAQGEYFLILNSDVEFKDAIVPEMVSFLKKNPGHAGVGGQMYFTDGRLQINCSKDYPLELAFYNFTLLGKFFKKRTQGLVRNVFYQEWDRRSSRDVEVIPDSLLTVRRAAFSPGESLYDDQFSLYFTENDLCLRLRKKGHKLLYLVGGHTIHLESLSVATVDPAIISKIYRQDIFRYFKKYNGLLPAFVLCTGISLTRCLIHLLKALGLYKFKKNLVWGIQ